MSEPAKDQLLTWPDLGLCFLGLLLGFSLNKLGPSWPCLRLLINTKQSKASLYKLFQMLLYQSLLQCHWLLTLPHQ